MSISAFRFLSRLKNAFDADQYDLTSKLAMRYFEISLRFISAPKRASKTVFRVELNPHLVAKQRVEEILWRADPRQNGLNPFEVMHASPVLQSNEVLINTTILYDGEFYTTAQGEVVRVKTNFPPFYSLYTC